MSVPSKIAVNKKNSGLPKAMAALFLAAGILGITFSVQFKAQNSPERELYQQRQENLIVMVKNLTEKRQRLSQEMSVLSSQLYDRRNAFEDESMTLRSLEQQLLRLDIANGARPVTGQGLEAQFQSSAHMSYGDLIVLVNELWAAGAEAIAVSGYRLSSTSYIFYSHTADGEEITVNNNPVTWPLRVQAIGDAGSLERGLTLPGGFMDMMMYSRIYPTLRQKELLELPAVSSPPQFYFLKPYQPPADSQGAAPGGGAPAAVGAPGVGAL
ncbi:MAG: DUF881 domain-containing protein [Peptococcaceae bacterium]|jgi:uncharacterized protein YlxW (UPF0749 family)|nr:DUF881 domain-containing protein [Peptococcaceae bacterium]